MTSKQKGKIQDMRFQGLGYTRIAETLGISVNTVKSFCRRSNLSACSASEDMGNYVNNDNRNETINGNPNNKEACKQCGRQLILIEKSKPKLFCNDKCRMAWWKKHPEAVNRKAVYYFKCLCCGKEFNSYGNSQRKFCSRTCFGTARRLANG